MTSTTSIYHADSLAIRVAGYMVGKPLWWALGQLNLTSDGSEQTPSWNKLAGDYVFIELLEVSNLNIIEFDSLMHVPFIERG
jgi:charged multivesicular body protein 7